MKRILVQFDTDDMPSVFDRVVAVDSDVDFLFSYGGVSAENVERLVHGVMFTRGGSQLANSAIFVGGSVVEAGEAVFNRVCKTFFGPVRCSVMMDSNGSNTTASAAVLCAARHLQLNGATAVVLGGTGPVGLRAAQLLAMEGATVRVASRSAQRSAIAAGQVRGWVAGANVSGVEVSSAENAQQAISGAAIVIAAGAAGKELLAANVWKQRPEINVLVDLNAYPPAGIAGVEAADKGTVRDGVTCYGAYGVGGLKMKIHKACVRQLFTANTHVLDTSAIYAIGKGIA